MSFMIQVRIWLGRQGYGGTLYKDLTLPVLPDRVLSCSRSFWITYGLLLCAQYGHRDSIPNLGAFMVHPTG